MPASPLGASPNEIKRLVPGPPWYHVPYKVWRIRSNPLASIAREIREHGDIVRLQMGPFNVYFLVNPDHINHVLVKNNQNYSRLTVDYLKMQAVLGKGLITTDGPSWTRQRRMIQPEFHSERMGSFAAATCAITNQMLDDWEQKIAHEPVVDIADEMAKLMLRITANTLFSVDSAEFSALFGEAAVTLNRHVDEDATRLFELPHSVPTRRNRRFQKALTILNRAVFEIIRHHRQSRETNDLVSMLIQVKDPETGERLTDQEIRDQVVTFLMAGHETSANALAWTWHLLSNNSHVVDRLYQEVTRTLGDREPTYKDVRGLTFTKQVLQESMRLYPPVWSVSRKAIADDRLMDFYIPRGSYLYISIYSAHRHPSFWHDPDQFDPDRFSPEQVERQSKASYMPFGAGPHICIGREFAMMTMQMVLAKVIRKYRFKADNSHSIDMEPLITLRPKSGIKLSLHPRDGAQKRQS